MLTLQVEDLLVIVLVWLLCGFVSAIMFVRFIVLRYAGKAVISAITNPDEETKGAVAALLNMIMTVPIKTGRKIKDEEGHEREEVLPFSKFMLREISNYILSKFKASIGGSKTAMGEEIEGAIDGDMRLKMLSTFKPKRRNQSRLDWLIEVVTEHPEVLDRLKNVQKDTSGGL